MAKVQDVRKEFLPDANPKVFVRTLRGKTPELAVQAEAVSVKDPSGLLREAWESAQPSAKKRVSSRRNR